MRLTIFSYWLLFSAVGFAEIPCAENDLTCSLAQTAKSYAGEGILSGVLLVRKNGQDFSLTYGLANEKSQTTNSLETRFLIASLSKAFVAASILKLKDQKALDLHEPLSRYIPEYPNGQALTLENLLTHTSGIPEAYDTPQIYDHLGRNLLGFSDFVHAIAGQNLSFAPGSRFQYSNTGYVMLGEVVRRVSGMSYTEALTQNFIEGFDLKHTTVGYPKDPAIPLARSYEGTGKNRIDIHEKYGLKNALVAEDLFADTNICTNAGDLATWVESITTGKGLSQDSYHAMLTPGLEGYGYGWFVFHDDEDRLTYEHSGGFDGYRSWVRRYPDQGTTVIWLSNQGMAPDQLQGFIDKMSETALQ